MVGPEYPGEGAIKNIDSRVSSRKIFYLYIWIEEKNESEDWVDLVEITY